MRGEIFTVKLNNTEGNNICDKSSRKTFYVLKGFVSVLGKPPTAKKRTFKILLSCTFLMFVFSCLCVIDVPRYLKICVKKLADYTNNFKPPYSTDESQNSPFADR